MQGALAKGRTTLDCHICYSRQNIERLLIGFDGARISASEQLDRIGAQLDEVRSGQRRIEAYAAESAPRIRAVFKILGHEITDCPRLATVERAGNRGWFRRPWRDTYVLTLWCEEPGREHPVAEGVYALNQPRTWLAEALPYIRLVSRVLRAAVPVVVAVPSVVLSQDLVKRVDAEIALLKELAGLLPPVEATWHHDDDGPAFMTMEEGAGLRALRHLLLEKDPARLFGGLRRVTTFAGDLLWVWLEHHRAYDPGLPQLPN